MRSFLKRMMDAEFISRARSGLPSRVFRKNSYSQCGEDLVVAFVLELIHGKRPVSYLDVGANHPFYLSNTALLYDAGGHGTLIEPDPYLASLLRRKRSRDTVLQSGVHFSGESKAEFFVMEPPTLNTFSRQEMARCVEMGHNLRQTIQVELRDVNSILEQTGPLDFMNLDIEGLDKAILEKVDWDRFRPTCICVETLRYEMTNEPRKLSDIIDLMGRNDYFPYADSFINTIFIDRKQWDNRWQSQ